VKVGCGTTCGCLGDERNLREFLIADETARRLREAGHPVISLLVDDSLDPLDYRQLRIAANKDEAMIEKWVDWCGKPASHVPDPWDCHASYSAHFQEALLDRLHALGCHPSLVSTASLYEGGLYAPFVHEVLSRYDEIMAFLGERFCGYQPENLYRVLCPKCGYIDQTVIEAAGKTEVRYHCGRCEESASTPIDEVKGKLGWKLDCAARWVILGIHAEPFSKAYLDPRAGSFTIAQEISKRYFGGHDVFPLRYGSVRMDKSVSYRLLPSMPGDVLRGMYTERAASDIAVTEDFVLNWASRCKLEYGLSYLDCVKQLVPMWLLKPQALTDRQLDVVSRGIRFAEDFLDQEVALQLPTREYIEEIPPDVLAVMHDFMDDMLDLRERCHSYEAFGETAKQLVQALGDMKHEVTGHLRGILGQKQGMPVSRLIFLLPVNYLRALEYMLHLRVGSAGVRLIVSEERLAA
jgi:ribosomal protein S27AE